MKKTGLIAPNASIRSTAMIGKVVTTHDFVVKRDGAKTKTNYVATSKITRMGTGNGLLIEELRKWRLT